MFVQIVFHLICPNIVAVISGYYLASTVFEIREKCPWRVLGMSLISIVTLFIVHAVWHTDLTLPNYNLLLFASMGFGMFIRTKSYPKRPGMKTPVVWCLTVFVGVPCSLTSIFTSIFLGNDHIINQTVSPDHKFTAYVVSNDSEWEFDYVGLKSNSPFAILETVHEVAEVSDGMIDAVRWTGPHSLMIIYTSDDAINKIGNQRWKGIDITYSRLPN